MKKLLKREEGMTLTEVLAAITILGIVMVGFLTIFPRMTEVNLQTEKKLETMNLARVELNYLQQSDSNSILLDEENYVREPWESLGYTTFTAEKADGFTYVITHYEEADLKGRDERPEEPPGLKNLYKIHIQVKDGEEVISETFGYVEYGIVATDVF